jgi:BirA family transcriptional regulator, biotin operon repressor / biotin---[acetyl-CoA-carboxylase] ligase
MGDTFLDADQLRAASFIHYVEIHDSLGSTNDRATELACDPSLELPALIAAREQTAGRGRGKNKWWSADGALTFSLLLDPVALGIHTVNWPQLSLATAVAVCDALAQELETAAQRTGASSPPAGVADDPARSNVKLSLGIKWPNDIMLESRKVCGILITSPGGPPPAKGRLVIGIGINVNNSWRNAPRELGLNGSALCDATGRTHDMQRVLIGTLQALDERFHQLGSGESQFASSWQQLCGLTHHRVESLDGGRRVIGICLGIDRDGALLVENAAGIHKIVSGSVRVLPRRS